MAGKRVNVRVGLVGMMVALLAGMSLGQYSGGAGTEVDPFQIATAGDLTSLGQNTGDYDKYFIMTADIDLAGYEFDKAVIAPEQYKAFSGVFDGGGHTIDNFTLLNIADLNDMSYKYFGIFGNLGISGHIKHLNVTNLKMYVEYAGTRHFTWAGGLVGRNEGILSQCYVEGDIQGKFYISSGTSSFYYYIGGMAGHNIGHIEESCSQCIISVEGSGYAGGLTGRNGQTIFNCYSNGQISGDVKAYYYLGGITGINGGDITNCYTQAKVSGGGASGSFSGSTFRGQLSACFWNNDINHYMPGIGDYDVADGLYGMSSDELKNSQMYLDAGWDFSIWTICDGMSYPVLLGVGPEVANLSAEYGQENYFEKGPNESLVLEYCVSNNGLLNGEAASSMPVSIDVLMSTNAGVDWEAPEGDFNIVDTVYVEALESCTQYSGEIVMTTPSEEGVYYIRMKAKAGSGEPEYLADDNWSEIIVLAVGEEFQGGQGISCRAHCINTIGDFVALTHKPELWHEYIVLLSDLDILEALVDSNDVYEIGDPESPYNPDWIKFEGILNGLGHLINYNLDAKSLFGFIGENGIVKNLNLKVNGHFNYSGRSCYSYGGMTLVNYGEIRECSINNHFYDSDNFCDDYNNTVGGIAAINYGIIQNCISTGYLSKGKVGEVGGIAGENYGILDSCQCDSRIKTTYYEWDSCIGGLVGRNHGEIYRSHSQALIENRSTLDSDCQVGGLVGGNQGYIMDCSAEPVILYGSVVGGLVGINYKFGMICFSHSNLVIAYDETSHYYSCGGLVGQNDGKLFHCYAEVDIETDTQAGGLVGYNVGEIGYCYAEGSVSGKYYIGGLVSSLGRDSIIEESYARCDVAGGVQVGGLIGYINNLGIGFVRHCYASGKVIGTDMVGGLVGGGEGVTFSVWDIEASGLTEGLGDSASQPVGVLGLTTAQMGQKEFYEQLGWDFESIWRIDPDSGLPDYRDIVDIRLEDVGPIGKAVIAGEETVIRFIVKNVSNTFANGTASHITTRIYLTSSADVDWEELGEEAVVAEHYLDQLKAGEYQEVELTIQAPMDPGIYFYRVSTVVENWEDEVNRDNNWSQPISLAAGYNYGGGIGTYDDPFLIYTVDQFNTIGLIRDHWESCFKLMQDIDLANLSDGQYNQIGFSNGKEPYVPFQGTLYGNHHVVQNFTWKGNGKEYVGLFAYLGDQSNIYDLIMKQVDIDLESNRYVGAIAGYNLGKIQNCRVDGMLKARSFLGGLAGFSWGRILDSSFSGRLDGFHYVGGVAGENKKQIVNNHVDADIVGNTYVGGIAGLSSAITDSSYLGHLTGIQYCGGIAGQSTGQLERCGSSGIITGERLVGGVAGACTGNQNLLECYSLCQVEGTGDYIGGLVGSINGSIVDKCCATGEVNGIHYVGGLIGSIQSGRITNCYASGAVCGDTYVGGFTGYRSYNMSDVLTQCYCCGAVSGSGVFTGGFQGDGSRGQHILWDIDTANQALDVGSEDGTGNTLSWPEECSTAEMQTQSTYLDCEFDFNTIWVIQEGRDYARLRGVGPQYCVYGGGMGSYRSPYLISTAEQMIEIGYHPEDWMRYFVLTNDIDMNTWSGKAAIPIGNSEVLFKGNFDGRNYTIFNYTLVTDYTLNTGIFGESGAGVISNLRVENIYIDAIYAYQVGGLVGSLKYDCEVYNCHVDGYVKGQSSVGGLIGNAEFGSRIDSCSFEGHVVGGFSTGGLMGQNDSRVYGCYTNALVESHSNAGGFIGINSYMVHNCKAEGQVTGSSTLGGFIGENSNGGELLNNLSMVSISETASESGGFCGINKGAFIYGCFWDKDKCQGCTSVGSGEVPSGIKGWPTGSLYDQYLYLSYNWDFVNESGNGIQDIWHMPYQDEGYPMLWWQKDIPGDFAGSYGVDFIDFAAISENWLCEYPWRSYHSLDPGNGIVEMDSLIHLANNWLEGGEWLDIDPLVGYYPFDSNGDDQQEGYHGSLINGATIDGDQAHIGAGALVLDGLDDYVDCGTDSAVVSIPHMAVAMWVKADEVSFTNTMHMIGQRDLSSHVWSFQLWGAHGGHLTGFVGGSDVYALTETEFTPEVGRWTHVAMMYDDFGDRKVHVYVDGVEVETVQQSALSGDRVMDTTIPVTIGDRDGGGKAFGGAIDDLRIYRRVLTEAEIIGLAQMGD